MDDVVMVTLPLSAEAAAALADPGRKARAGQLLSAMLRPAAPGHDPLATMIAELKAEARAAGLTDAEIEAELAEYNAKDRL